MKFDKFVYTVVCIAAALLLVTANAAATHVTDKHIILSQPIKPLPFYRERIAVVYKDPKVKSDLPGYVCVDHHTDVFTLSVKQQHDRQSIALAVKLCNTPEVKKALKKLGLTPIYQSATIYKFPDFKELDVLLMDRYGRKVGCLAKIGTDDNYIIEIAVTSTYNPTIEKVYLIKKVRDILLPDYPAILNTLFASMLTRTRVAIIPMWLQVLLNDICKPQIKVAYKAAIFKILDIYDLPLPHSRVSTIHYTDVYVFAPNQVGYR